MDGFAALADPTRRHIIDLLISGERAAGDIASEFPVSAAAVSQHLKSLREARLVKVRVEAQRRIYAIDPEGFCEIDAWIKRTRIFWKNSLDRLEEALAEEARSKTKTVKRKGKKS